MALHGPFAAAQAVIASSSGSATPITLQTACVQPEGSATCSPISAELPFRWDTVQRRHDGTARLVFRWQPGPLEGDIQALLLHGAGNSLTVALNDRVVLQVGDREGRSDPQGVDAGKRPWLVPLASDRIQSINTITVTLGAAEGRGAQISQLSAGPFSAMQAHFDQLRLWQVETTRILMWIAAFIGAVCAVMAMIQRDRLIAACGVAHLAWALRLADVFWIQPPLPWPLWSAVMAGLFVLTQAALAYFFLEAANRWTRQWHQGFLGAAGVSAAVLVTAAIAGATTLTYGWLLLATLCFISITLYVAKVAFGQRLYWRWLLAAWMVTSLAAGLADLSAAPLSVPWPPTWSRLAVGLFSLALVTLVARQLREAQQADQLRARELRQALAKQQHRLQTLHEEEARRGVERATFVERQRLMRDMHDGLGAQLYGLHALAGRPESARKELQGQIRQAIEELRLVVDAMNPFDGDLAAMLGDLRPPLERRLALSQVELRWAVDELPTISDFSPAKVQHLKRLLLEAATNIARHSGANEARFAASAHDGLLSLEFADNGRGFDPNSPKAGNGLRNMRWRAMMIGAQFAMESKGGCCLKLKMPLAALKASATPLASMSAPSNGGLGNPGSGVPESPLPSDQPGA